MELDINRDIWSKSLPCWERGQMDGRTRKLNVTTLYNNLADVHKVFDKHGIKHWLSHGTFLGAYRDGQFILWDDDCDLGADFSQRATCGPAIEELRSMGYYIPNADPSKPISLDNAPYYDFHIIKDGSKVEVWFFEKQPDGYWIYDKPRCGNTLRHEGKYYESLGKFNFRGLVMDCPNFAEQYLVMMYGPTWRTPDPNKKYNHQG